MQIYVIVNGVSLLVSLVANHNVCCELNDTYELNVS